MIIKDLVQEVNEIMDEWRIIPQASDIAAGDELLTLDNKMNAWYSRLEKALNSLIDAIPDTD